MAEEDVGVVDVEFSENTKGLPGQRQGVNGSSLVLSLEKLHESQDLIIEKGNIHPGDELTVGATVHLQFPFSPQNACAPLMSSAA